MILIFEKYNSSISFKMEMVGMDVKQDGLTYLSSKSGLFLWKHS